MFANRFSVYSTLVYSPYATSSFSQHSLLSAAGVVSDITQLCAYPIIAKLEDVVGRAEGFLFATVFMAVSSIMYAASPNIETYLVSCFTPNSPPPPPDGKGEMTFALKLELSKFGAPFSDPGVRE